MKILFNRNRPASSRTFKDQVNLLFSDPKGNIDGLSKYFNFQEKSFIQKKIKNKKKGDKFLLFSLNDSLEIIIAFLDDKLSEVKTENLGAELFILINKNNLEKITIINNNIKFQNSNLIEFLAHGIKLKSYTFEKYKSKKTSKKISINLISKENSKDISIMRKLDSVYEGVKFTRDLVSEPGNILHPDEYAKRLKLLKKYGLKINIYDNKKLKKLGMNALLGVGQGSIRGSYLVTMEWNGAKNNSKPLAFIGKGVCFDTGGISLKPAKFMEDMTYDMAGSAVVVGLMQCLALRKAKVNAVGVVGLVENMPGGNAQRPGDIVKSYSGKTIEVLNTDAEGRLVLADALTFTEKKFKPKFMVDLATLTGAIIVSLGSEYAGLFSNDDKLSKDITSAGKDVEEKVWRMPLDKNFDKLINSKNADMQNINYVGGAGSITAAQFLQRFIINKTPWAHLDIAGMAFSKYGGALNSGGATGFGVRLLNKLIEDNYE